MADPTDEEDIPALEADEESLAQVETQGPLIVKEAEGRWAREAMDDALALGWEEEESAISGEIEARSTLVPKATPPSAPRRQTRSARPWAMALAGAAVLALSTGATFAFGAVVVFGWSLGGNSAPQATIVPSAPAETPAPPPPAPVSAAVEPVTAATEPAPAPEVVAATPTGTAPAGRAPQPRAKTSKPSEPPPAAAAPEPARVADAPPPPPAPAPAAEASDEEKRGLFRKKKDR